MMQRRSVEETSVVAISILVLRTKFGSGPVGHYDSSKSFRRILAIPCDISKKAGRYRGSSFLFLTDIDSHFITKFKTEL